MSAQIFQWAEGITNRPDLVVEHQLAFRRALSYYHSLEYWTQDMVTVNTTAAFTNGVANLNLADLTPTFCGLTKDQKKCLTVNGQTICPSTGCAGGEGFAVIGNSLNIKSSKLPNCGGAKVNIAVTFSYKSCPTVSDDGCSSDSWLAAKHPEIIAMYMGEQVNAFIEKRTASYRREDRATVLRSNLYL